MTSFCSWSSFFQLLNSALKVGLPMLLERTADAARLPAAGRLDAELLQLGGGDLVADVERLGDERGLLRAAAARRERAGRRWRDGRWYAAAWIIAGSIFWPVERGFDQRLALLEQARAGLGRGRQRESLMPCGRVIRRAVA